MTLLKVFLAYSSKERRELELKVIQLNNNDLTKLKENDFLALCIALLDCTNLVQLSLEHNNLGGLSLDRVNNLGKTLSKLPNLERLSLRDNFLNVQTTTEIIKECQHLQILRLRGNNYLSDNEPEQLKKLIVKNNKQKGLKLFNFLILPKDQLDKLKCLDLSFDNFASENNVLDLELIGEVLSLCTSLEVINLDNNNLCHLNWTCLQVLGRAISQCPNLKKLALSDNRLKVSSIKCITEKCRNLEEVKIDPEYGDKIYINEEEHQQLQQLKAKYNRKKLVLKPRIFKI